MNPHERAEKLFDEAQKLGLDAPTEGMIAEAISAAEFSAVLDAAGQKVLDKWLDKTLAEDRQQLEDDHESPFHYFKGT